MILPGEGPSAYRADCNCDNFSPKRYRDVTVMDRGSSDEAIVGVKPAADEDAETHQRVKLLESDMDVGAEGWNMLLGCGILE